MEADELRLWVFQTTLYEAFSCEKTFEVRKHKDKENTRESLRFFDHVRYIRALKPISHILSVLCTFVVNVFWRVVFDHLRQLRAPEAWFENSSHIRHIRTFKFLNKILSGFVVKFILKLLILPIIGAE
ncbi:hypothetical protein [Pedobacter ginsenosidimutans]|uniref:hypothetical protein n=1 Tax=Pedobacter ginsenosidimutans TaxID=687842 RepID=UPI001FD835F2|nr:hypothetical protein [Pedobacter ginsenosidimutans]